MLVDHDRAEDGNPFTMSGVTPLMLAVEGHFRDAVEILLSEPDIGNCFINLEYLFANKNKP